MATPTYITLLDGLKGKLNKKDKTVFRQKHARDANGNIIADMRPEAYVVQHPRDWKKKPAKGAEKKKQDRWTNAVYIKLAPTGSAASTLSFIFSPAGQRIS